MTAARLDQILAYVTAAKPSKLEVGDPYRALAERLR